MFRHTIPLGRIFGILIDLDYSWFLIVILLTWMMAVGYYPAQIRNGSPGEYWLLGFLTAVMLFVSVLLHELGHSVVAQKLGLSVPRITLFLFGGVSQIASEPPNAVSEFQIAVVGPAVSFVLALLFWELEALLTRSPSLLVLDHYLFLLNLILGVFNLIPGFPLDGGRVFRAILWRVTGNYQRSTAMAALSGRFFGFVLIFFGVWQVFSGNLIGGLWTAFIGWFLESAAGSQLQQEMVKTLLGHHTAAEVMKHDYPQIPGNVPLQDLVDHHVLTEGVRYFLVKDGAGTTGLVTLSAIRKVPRSEWPRTTASQVMVPLEKLHTISPQAELRSAIEKMGRDGVNQLPVTQGNDIVGVLSREDILHYLQLRQAFGNGAKKDAVLTPHQGGRNA